MDELLYESQGPSKTVYWRPGYGRSITLLTANYRNFTKVVRTVHVDDALSICQKQRMEPKPIFAASILKNKFLSYNHPCKNMKVLWFGTQPESNTDEEHDWYGNVQFAIPAYVLVQRWKYCYLVEMVTARTHTTTRLLITNKDYGGILPQYNPYAENGPWLIYENEHFVLEDCARYNNIGYNRHGHQLEFMIEVTQTGQTNILRESEVSFRNHSEATNTNRPLRCHRNQFATRECSMPFTSAVASRVFFDQHQKMASVSPVASPRLSERAEYYRYCHFMMSNGPSSISHSLTSANPQLSIPPPNIPRYMNFLVNKQFPAPYLSRGVRHTLARIFQHSGGSTQVFTQETFQSINLGNPSNFQSIHQHEFFISWWWSLDDYCRSVLIWYWSQERHENNPYIPGWPIPRQLQQRRRRNYRNQRRQHPHQLPWQ